VETTYWFCSKIERYQSVGVSIMEFICKQYEIIKINFQVCSIDCTEGKVAVSRSKYNAVLSVIYEWVSILVLSPKLIVESSQRKCGITNEELAAFMQRYMGYNLSISNHVEIGR